jgi:hypothetical protein
MSKHKRRRSRARNRSGPPKGAYRLPTGGYAVEGPWGPPNKRGRRIRMVAVHRDEPDVDKMIRALLGIIAEQQLEQRQSDEALRRPGARNGKPASGKTRRK